MARTTERTEHIESERASDLNVGQLTEAEYPPEPEAGKGKPWYVKPFIAFEDRTGLYKVLKPIIQHPIPPNTGWGYVFGSLTLTAFIVQILSGITLALFYSGSAEDAYQSVQFISHDLIFGSQLRTIHNYGAAAMMILIGLHMIRVFLYGSFKFPREVNWLSGVVLFVLTVTISFEGQIMRWDQDGMWTLVILINQVGRIPIFGTWLVDFVLGGQTLGAPVFNRIVGTHMLWFPGIIILVLVLHLYLVIHNGISEPPRIGRPVDPRRYRQWYDDMLRKVGVPFWPDAMWRDVVASAGLVTLLIVLAWTYGPKELTAPPDPTVIHALPRPDFYFLWYFGLLALSPPHFENRIIIGAPVALVIALLIIPIWGYKGERHPFRRPWSVVFVLMTVFTVGFYTIEGQVAPWSPDYANKPLPPSVTAGLSGAALEGATLFHTKGCEFCHNIGGYGGIRGPNLGDIADKLTPQEMTIRISEGATFMPAFGGILSTEEMSDLVAFLQTRHRTEFATK